MEIRMSKLAAGLALVLLSSGLGGCQLLGSEKASEANDSAATAPKAIPVENVQSQEEEAKVARKSINVIAATPLTRPTDPDVRVKAIKKGRSNPFAELVAPAATKAQPLEASQPKSSAVSNKSTNSSFPSSSGTKSALGNQSSRIAKASSTSNPSTSKTSTLPRLDNPVNQVNPNDIILPPLPEATLAKQVSVQGVMMLGGQPKAILKAPNENVARTVQVGDYLANGQILVASIDMSNPQTPRVVLAESGQQVIVGVGKSPESLTASVPF